MDRQLFKWRHRRQQQAFCQCGSPGAHFSMIRRGGRLRMDALPDMSPSRPLVLRALHWVLLAEESKQGDAPILVSTPMPVEQITDPS